MLVAEGATRQGVSAPRRPVVPRTARIGASAPPKRNHRLRAGRARLSKLPRFGMSTKPASAAKIEAGGRKKTRVRAAVVGAGIGRMQLAACIHQQAPGIPNYGFSCRPTASILTRARLARCLRASGRARSEPHGGQRQILRVLPYDTAMDSPAGGARPAAARNGAPICRNAVRRGEPFSGG